MNLHAHAGERVALERWSPDTRFEPHTHRGGDEAFVLDGRFHDEHGACLAGTWLRNPDGSRHGQRPAV